MSIAIFYSHSLALKSDGTIWAWGANSVGQLGDSTTVNKNYPVKVKAPTGITFIDAGGLHSLALKADGTVWGWGDNSYGNLGSTGTGQLKEIKPFQVMGLSGITSVCGGKYFSLALKNDGTVWACGTNDNGQLGTGTASAGGNTLVQVSGLTGVTSITAGATHSLALKSDSSVWAWGYNTYGNIGDGSETRRNAPVKVNYLKNIKSISASWGYNSAAIEKDGTVWTWGDNSASQLGVSFLVVSRRSSPDRVVE